MGGKSQRLNGLGKQMPVADKRKTGRNKAAGYAKVSTMDDFLYSKHTSMKKNYCLVLTLFFHFLFI